MNNREILFRGKRVDNGEWVEGFYGTHSGIEAFIIDRPYISMTGDIDAMNAWDVAPETVSAYTGLLDKNAQRLFEGDILEIDGEDGLFLLEWSDDQARFVMNGDGLTVDFDNFYPKETEIVGNIHDDPHLMEAVNG